MNIGISFIAAVTCMVAGHMFKVFRWGNIFISVYEKPSMSNLLNAMSVGHAINTILPVRIGDLFRIIWSGRKLKNGSSFSIATVMVDLYIDLIFAGMMIFGLMLIGKGGGSEQVEIVAQRFLFLFFVLILFSFMCIAIKKYVKKLIGMAASIFNDTVEFELLYISYLCIAAVKDITRNTNKKKFVIYTVGMWFGYAISYWTFARALQESGFFYTMSDVFILLFSGRSLIYVHKEATFLWLAYLLLPLVICLLVAFIIGTREGQEQIGKRVLPQLNQSDRLAFLKTYYSEEKKDYIKSYLDINQDVTVIEDQSAGSNASTVVVMKGNGELFFRKYAFHEDGWKLQDQIDWMEQHGCNIPLPVITEKRNNGIFVTYDMHSYSGAIGLFRLIHTMPLDQSWNVLSHALNDIHSGLHTVNCRNADRKTLEDYLVSKVDKNLKLIAESDKYIRNLEQYPFIWVNGRRYYTMQYYKEMFSHDHLRNIFAVDQYADIHGDLTVENIVCLTGQTEIDQREYVGKIVPVDYYFIDPNTGNIHDSPFLDFAKLLQSLHGNYEFLMKVHSVKIEKDQVHFLMAKSEAYANIYKKYQAYLKTNFSSNEVLSIYYHEVIHWLRLMPYKIQKNEKLAVVFYTGMLSVLEDVWEMEHFEEEKIGNF